MYDIACSLNCTDYGYFYLFYDLEINVQQVNYYLDAGRNLVV